MIFVKILPLFFFISISLFLISFSRFNNFSVLHEVTGPIGTNCYLLYDEESKKAALFDVGGPIDNLEFAVRENNLNLEYIFITHAHCDHIQGLPAIKNKYEDVKICFSREEYEDMSLYSKWETTIDARELEEIRKQPRILEMMNVDFKLIGKPHIFLEDDKLYKLGNLEIRTFLSPGHSRGSICFSVCNVLFSGDVLFYRGVGRIDFPNSGGKKELVKSVRRLYNLLPDETIVYPGHGPFTDIGSEKKENRNISIDNVFFNV